MTRDDSETPEFPEIPNNFSACVSLALRRQPVCIRPLLCVNLRVSKRLSQLYIYTHTAEVGRKTVPE